MIHESAIVPRGEAEDLSTCDTEPIHIPGSIQPHGALLSLDENDLTVLQASENVAVLFGRETSGILGSSFAALLDEENGDALLRTLRSSSLERDPLYVGSITASGPDRIRHLYHVIAHRYEGNLILEFEAANHDQTISFHNLYPLVRTFMARLQEVSTVSDLAEIAAKEIRRVTGFDRVLVYQFDRSWHGHVIAESRDEQVSSFLDLWFPASDIPAQARELYRVNRLRIIPNATYKAVPLVPAFDPRSGKPLDLSYASLRSVSPVHLEYLVNMGVAASMSISVLLDGRLWGLIALHHRAARTLPFEVRVACDFLGQALSTQIGRSENQAEYEHRLHLKTISATLLGFMAEEEQFIDGLIHHPNELLSLGSASGAAVVFEGQCTLLGQTPSEQSIVKFTDWLSMHGHKEVFHTDCVRRDVPDSGELREQASGILAISISKLYSSYILWFRPEVIRTIKWSGDPTKQVETEADGKMRIHPRKSFDTWKETVRDRSLPWRNSEIESAGELRNALIGVVLKKAEELAAISAELTRSNKELEAFSYSVSHDLRAPFRHIIGYSELLTEHLEDQLDDTARRYIGTISKAAESAGLLVDNLLNFSRVGRAKLHVITVDMNQLLQEVKRSLPPGDDRPGVIWDIGVLPSVQGDPVLLRMVLQNLIENALKFTRSRDNARISINATEREHEFTFCVADNGVGFKQAYANKLFGVFQRLHSQEEFEGVGIGLANVRRAVGKHGGQTWAEGETGKGATFWFSLPRKLITEREANA